MTDRIDPETLAALLDGSLKGAERERALAAIARSPESYEDLVEASALVREIAEPRRRVVRWWIPVLAAAGLAAVVFVIGNRERDPLLLASQLDLEVTGSLASALGPDWRSLDWPVTRGGDGTPEPALVVRAGARWVDLHAAAAAGDSAAMRETAFDLAALLATVGGGSALAAGMNTLSSDDTGALEALGPRVRSTMRDGALFDAAMWLERTRLVGLGGTAPSERDPWKLSQLDDIVSRIGTDNDAQQKLATELRRLHTQWSRSAPDHAAAADEAFEILRRAGG